MGLPDDKLAEIDAALDDLTPDESEVSAVLRRFENASASELASVDEELEGLGSELEVPTIESRVKIDPSMLATKVPEAPVAVDGWDDEKTEVEIIDEADDFVLLVDEDDLEALESASEEAPQVTVPPPLPAKGEGTSDDEAVEDEEDEGFFKKLFGSRRASERP